MRRVNVKLHLRLNGVEVGEVVQSLKVLIMQHCDWQWLQIEQFCVWWVLVWQYEVLERYGQHCVGANPAIRHCMDEVLYNGVSTPE